MTSVSEELEKDRNARQIFLAMMDLIDALTHVDQQIEYLIDEGIDIEKIKNCFEGQTFLMFKE